MTAAEPTPATVSVRQAAWFMQGSESWVRDCVRDGEILGYISDVRGRRSYRVDRQWLLDFVGLDDYNFDGVPTERIPVRARWAYLRAARAATAVG